MKIIELNSISKRFGSNTVLENILLEINQGGFFGLLGPSGAGKTTMIKIMTGQLKADSGKARLFDTDCNNITHSLYTQIGMVLDNSGLYERLSCYDNLCLFADIYKINKKRISDVLEKVELTDAKKTPVNKLSKGMRQRLALARAIFHKPKLLFLDEPTSGLDPATTLRIHEMLNELKSEGTTIFLTTHNMEEASKLCDTIALLNEGKIIEQGSPDEICRKYNTLNTVNLLCKDGTEIILPNSKESSAKIAYYFENETVRTIHSSEPNLETVFIKLTGRSLV